MAEYRTNLYRLSTGLGAARGTAKSNLVEEVQKHQANEKRWGYYGEGLIHYNGRFKHLLPPGGFSELVNEFEGAAVLDAFAPASFIRDLKKNSKKMDLGISLSLADLRTPLEAVTDKLKSIHQLKDADLYDSKKWKDKVLRLLNKHGKSGFDIITCLPIGGWTMENQEGTKTSHLSLELIWTVTNTLWKLLNENGTMFISFPGSRGASMEEWMDIAKKKYGIDIEYDPDMISARISKKNSKMVQFPFPAVKNYSLLEGIELAFK